MLNWTENGNKKNLEKQRGFGFDNFSYAKIVTLDSTKAVNTGFHTTLNICGKADLLQQRVQ